MDEAYRSGSGFSDLTVDLPCCGLAGNLNDLDYTFPQGFARWRVGVMNPGRDAFDEEELRTLGSALGHDVRVVLQHV
jgi:hypothetical protein